VLDNHEIIHSKIFASAFNTIQGEGRCAGEYVTFLRFYTQSCFPDRPRCVFCDTVGKKYYKPTFSLAELMSSSSPVLLSQSKHIVLTGGEPFSFSFKILNALIYHLWMEYGKSKIDVETNGSFLRHNILHTRSQNEYRHLIKFFDDANIITISPKLLNSFPNSSVETFPWISYFDFTMLSDLYKRYKTKMDFKFVIDETKISQDIAHIEHFVTLAEISNESIFLMPKTPYTQKGVKEIAELCVQKRWCFSPRLHVDIWGSDIEIER